MFAGLLLQVRAAAGSVGLFLFTWTHYQSCICATVYCEAPCFYLLSTCELIIALAKHNTYMKAKSL